MASWDTQRRGRALLRDEVGTFHKEAPHRLALVYPSPYRAAMASLGYQAMYRLVNETPGWAADRAMLPERDDPPGPLLTLEKETPVGNYRTLGFSVAYELEIAGVIECLERAGVPVLARDRSPSDPVVFAGGPLTFSNPAPLAPYFDAILLGEGEELLIPFLEEAESLSYRRPDVIAKFAGRHGYYVPEHDGDTVPPIAAADTRLLPACSQIITRHSELSSMYLTEAVRGCSRGCTYCVMRRSTNGGMRAIPIERVLAGVPDHARRVGLVGAAVTDHPRIADLVRTLVDDGREIGISSLRADKLTDEFVGLLARGGYRTLTTAADGASERMREKIERRTREHHLLRTAALGKKHKLKTVKFYLMLGLPDETDEDLHELIRLLGELSRVHPRVALGIAPFVAKRNTPLDGTPFAGIRLVDERLKQLRRGVKGRVQIRSTSSRWAWVEYMLAQGGPSAGLAVLDAYRNGATFAAYKQAFAENGCEPTGPRARVPSTREQIQLHRLKRRPAAAPACTA